MSLRLVAFCIALAVTLLVVSLSLGNALQLSTSFSFEGVDKVQHALAYATLGVLWSFAFRQNLPHAPRPVSWQWLWGALFLLGAILELCQYAFYPNRFFEFGDMLANGIGAGIGTLGFKRIFPT